MVFRKKYCFHREIHVNKADTLYGEEQGIVVYCTWIRVGTFCYHYSYIRW